LKCNKERRGEIMVDIKFYFDDENIEDEDGECARKEFTITVDSNILNDYELSNEVLYTLESEIERLESLHGVFDAGGCTCPGENTVVDYRNYELMTYRQGVGINTTGNVINRIRQSVIGVLLTNRKINII